MKKLLVCVAVLAATMGAKAQMKSTSDKMADQKVRFSIGAEASLPIGDFNTGYNFGYGGSAQVDLWVAPELALTLNAGYINYSGKSQTYTFTPGVTTTIKNPDAGLVPVLAGIKYKFGSSMVYGSAQIGAAFGTQSGGGTDFAYAPGIGYCFSHHIDALLKYQGYSYKSSTSSAIGLRVAYTF